MASVFGGKPPVWFWIVSGAFLLWQLMGGYAFYVYAVVGPDDPYQRHLGELMPFWYNWVFGVAVFAGIAAAVLLLMRNKLAKPLALASLIAVILQYGYVIGTTDLIAHQGLVMATGLPITIAVLGAVMLWFANSSIKRGWLS
ncbi:hypothetical protein OF829_00835 [Sphingomonas sp. LB-2]|uniref:hypothetical protein n=1 Tax=Sphingomonas caeni TaxID=2984949 RepID=UPI00222EC646|nr:hypothetical protein [Sphingomonas caeni]MCW3845766.1 hypothetical protein [Sphingomonas caeni]